MATCARAGAGAGLEPAEALVRCLERSCRSSLERTASVLREALKGLRHEATEAGSGLCAAILLHLLGKLAAHGGEAHGEVFCAALSRKREDSLTGLESHRSPDRGARLMNFPVD